MLATVGKHCGRQLVLIAYYQDLLTILTAPGSIGPHRTRTGLQSSS